jgi:hypothetical protein
MFAEGHRIGSLTVIGRAERSPGSRATWLICRCDCGAERRARMDKLKSGETRACKTCAQGPAYHEPTYSSYREMLRRCSDSRSISWKNYGGRGIRVCERWATSYHAFLADMGERPDGATLDRVDSAQDYRPGNCRWASWNEQARNRRSSRHIVVFGEAMTMAEAAERFGICYTTLKFRLSSGWAAERAVTAPVRKVSHQWAGYAATSPDRRIRPARSTNRRHERGVE